MSWALAVIAVIVLGYAVWVRQLNAVNVSAAMYFTTAGLAAGPVLGVLNLHLHGEDVRLLAEITLVLVLFSDASRVSPAALRRGAAVPIRLLAVGLPLTILAGTGVGALLLPGLTVNEAVILAVMLACTDAALGQAVVTDERLPLRIRQGLNIESGLNDGLCVPIFLIAIALAEAHETPMSGGAAFRIVGEQLGYGLLSGLVAGTVGVLALLAALRPERRDAGWRQILPVATAAAAAGGAVALGGSIFIAAFTAGLVFGWHHRQGETEIGYLVEESGELFNAVTFVVFGAAILGGALDHLTWQLLVYAVFSLTLVRMIPVAAAMLGTRDRFATVTLLGWFGPRGLASIVFAVILLDDTSLTGQTQMLRAVAITVGLSVYAHGLTARPGIDRYLRSHSSQPDLTPAGRAETDPAVRVRPRWHRPATPAAPDRGPTDSTAR